MPQRLAIRAPQYPSFVAVHGAAAGGDPYIVALGIVVTSDPPASDPAEIPRWMGTGKTRHPSAPARLAVEVSRNYFTLSRGRLIRVHHLGPAVAV